MFWFKIIATLTVSAFIIWGYWNEDKFVEFEGLLWQAIKKFVKEKTRRK